LDNWHLTVLEAVENYVRQGEDIDRRDLIAKRIDSVKLRDAVDVLIVAYARNQELSECLIIRPGDRHKVEAEPNTPPLSRI